MLGSDNQKDFYAVQLKPLNHEIANALVQTGEYYFKDSKKILDCFGLAYDKKDCIQAVNSMISFTKELKKLGCQMMNFGFRVVDDQEQKVAVTYTIQSFKHNNDPLWVNECLIDVIPYLALANMFADFWNKAYEVRPQAEIIKISNGL